MLLYTSQCVTFTSISFPPTTFLQCIHYSTGEKHNKRMQT